ncbi:hypothetical protein P9911_003815 [Klebsiella oxytoca]|uniref:hypothetical protein n=1 Tax=Klebsiella oxytoca TaxID=571 RepID=UPI00254A90E9|nr:hypothetical protein [Klebsiella oxytoca]MEC5504976.1 hypothetical protein [Klebsiella oxytoca]
MNQTTAVATLSTMTTEDLKSELVRGLEITARHLRHLAAIWRELETRGEDLSDIRHGLLTYMPLIANETVLPELVVNYAGQKTLLSALSVLPINEQQEIVKTGFVKTVTENGDEIETPASQLRAAEIHRIFDLKMQRIRTPDEQRRLLSISEKKPQHRPVTSIIGFDSQYGDELLVISGKRAKIGKILRAIAKKYPDRAMELIDVAQRFK